RALGERTLTLADAEPDRHLARHESINALFWVCAADVVLCDWPALAEHAARGEELSLAHRSRYSVALFLTWRALAARRLGRVPEARRLFRQAAARMARIPKAPESEYFDALCAY